LPANQEAKVTFIKKSNMTSVYLFDWGDTLMVDFPGVPGKMCDWEVLEAVDGAAQTLAQLCKSSRVYIATNAAQSNEEEIKRAFERVGLARYIDGYFCKANLGLSKSDAGFYEAIISRLNLAPDQVTPNQVTMVGDSLEKDIIPALKAGLNARWFNPTGKPVERELAQIQHLSELCESATR